MRKLICLLAAVLLLVSCGVPSATESLPHTVSAAESQPPVSAEESEAVSSEEEISFPGEISLEPFPEEISSESSAEDVSEETEFPFPVHTLQPSVTAKQAFLYDSVLNVAFVKGDLNKKIYPASITKLYTAYVALQYLDTDNILTAGDELSLVGAGSSIAYITRGHRLTVEMLIQGMMLPSGNDAAYVLAAGAGRAILGDSSASYKEAVEAFVAAMNEHAMADGLADTHFSVPDGYYREDHYTTMADLLKIALLVVENETIIRYTGMYSAKVMYASGETNSWTNTNKLLNPQSSYYRPDVVGLKTGFTSQSGYCLLTAEKRGDRWVLVGVFDCSQADSRFSDTVTLLESLV